MKPRENLLSWQVFLTTAVTKNISKTSIELDMDLKTVSRIVKELESDLGFILFDRSCRPFKLTEGAEKNLAVSKRTAPDQKQDRIQGPGFSPKTN